MSARVALREYYIRNNDFTVVLGKCHDVLSAPQYTDRERCYLYLLCVTSAKYLLAPAPYLGDKIGDLLSDAESSAVKAVELVDKCAEDMYKKTSAEYKTIIQNPAYADNCARAAAMETCIKNLASTILARILTPEGA